VTPIGSPTVAPIKSARLPRMRQIRWRTWRGVLVRSLRGFLDDNCTDWAAALTYYGLLAVFPSAIVVIALVGIVSSGSRAIDSILDIAGQLLPASVVKSISEPIHQVATRQTSARVLLSFGLIGAVWSASSYVGAFTRAANAIYGVREGRPFYLLRPLQLLVTIIALVLLAVVVVGLVISGPVAEAVGNAVGAGHATKLAWSIGKWPVLVFVAGFLLSLLTWIAPNVRQPRLRWLTVGGVVTLVVWALVSVGFGLYVANFGSYDVTYGSLGAVVVFLVWLYLSNSAVLLGVEINAELQRGRRLQGGEQAESGPALLPRTPSSNSE
jgi:membrane protein